MSGSAIVLWCGPDETRVQHEESKVDENGWPKDEFDVLAALLENALSKLNEARPPAPEPQPEEEEMDAASQAQKAALGVLPYAAQPPRPVSKKAVQEEREKADKEEREKQGRPQVGEGTNAPLQQTPPQGSSVPSETPEYQKAQEKSAKDLQNIEPLTGGQRQPEDAGKPGTNTQATDPKSQGETPQPGQQEPRQQPGGQPSKEEQDDRTAASLGQWLSGKS